MSDSFPHPNGLQDGPHPTWEWIRYQLGLRNLTIADVARAANVKYPSLSRAKWHKAPTAEAIIAAALGMKPHTLWPERYTRDGQPFGMRKQHTKEQVRTEDPNSLPA